MHALNVTTLILIIVGGLNWLLVGLFQVDLVASLFGGQASAMSRLVYILVGLSAIWQLIPLAKSFGGSEPAAQRDQRTDSVVQRDQM
jgi:uncharacterized membrane protein YuzA (DUF378 family)